METKDSENVKKKKYIRYIYKFERDIRPKNAVLTYISKAKEEWLNNNLDIKEIKNEKRIDLNLNKPKLKN